MLLPLHDQGCEIRGDDFVKSLNNNFKKAKEIDWSTEYLEKILSVKDVNGVEGAINHINEY